MSNYIREQNREFWELKGKVALWRIAYKLKIHENTLQRWLRTPLSKERKRLVMQALADIKIDIEEEQRELE